MSDKRAPAFHMPIEDSEVQAYLQRYPFATGPDAAMNDRGRKAIRREFALRPESLDRTEEEAAPVRLSAAEAALSGDALARALVLMDRLGISRATQDYLLNDFGWEAKLIPLQPDAGTPQSVLAVGCGDGMELIFVRAMLPDAAITGVDYKDNMTPELKAAIGLTFIAGDMKRTLDGFTGKFNLVFSNHTLEHLYTPDATLATLCGLLVPDGVLLSTLPMDAVAGSPFLEKVSEVARGGEIHLVETVYLDAGHPWKTNPADLRISLLAAGFARVELYQRAEHLSRPVAGTEAEFHRRKKFGLRLHALLFGSSRSLLKTLFPRQVPSLLMKVLQAVESRVWFGANRLKNAFTQEVCAVAFKSGEAGAGKSATGG